MFGEDFDKTTDNLIKEQALIDKIVNKSKNNFKIYKFIPYSPVSNSDKASTSNESHTKKTRPPFRGGGQPPFRARG